MPMTLPPPLAAAEHNSASPTTPPPACRARFHYTYAVANRLTHVFAYTYDVDQVRQCHTPAWLVVEVKPISGVFRSVHGASDSLADFPPLVGSLLV
jgi:hypothetical protein